jgi:hypothetical protein
MLSLLPSLPLFALWGTVPRSVETFVLWHIPMFVLIFSVLFIILAKVLHSAVNAMPLAVIGTAAAGALLAIQSNFVLRTPFIAVGDIVVVLGITVVVLVIYVMMKLGVVPIVGGH